MSRIMNKLGLGITAAIAIALLAALAGVVYGGPLDPPSGVTTSTSTQEVQITSLPYTISTPGSYVFVKNLTGSAGNDGIAISASDVTLDLRGFSLTGPGGTGNEVGVNVSSIVHGVTIRDGGINAWAGAGIAANGGGVTVSEARFYSDGAGGGPFEFAVYLAGSGSSISDCIVRSSGSVVNPAPSGGLGSVQFTGGVWLSGGTLTNCNVDQTLGVGIYGVNSVISDCRVTQSGHVGIYAAGGEIHGCVVQQNSSGAAGVVGLRTGGGSIISANTCSFVFASLGNNDACVYVRGDGSRVEANNVVGSGATTKNAIRVDDAGNTVIRNSAHGNVTNYSIVAGNTVGDITNVPGTVPTTPYANINY